MGPSYNLPSVCFLGEDAPHCPSSPYPNSIPTSLSPPYSYSATSLPPSQPKQFQSSSISTPPTTFPLFTLLPPELRLKIWHLTLPAPRLVPLRYQSSTAPFTPSTPKSHRGCTSPALIPITLQINHESRSLALQHYSLSFGLPGGISSPGSRPSTLPCKMYFSAERGDVLFFGVRGQERERMAEFVQACTMVHPGASGFGRVRRLAVEKELFMGRGGKGVSEMQLRLFWERVMGKFRELEELVFVEAGEDALGAFEREDVEAEVGLRGRNQMEDVCFTDDGMEFRCWGEERFEDKVERVVRSLETECGWVAPRWRVLGPQVGDLDTRMEGMIIGRQTRMEQEERLVRQMRGLFGHEGVSNAL
ncbi:hypothetical protein L207DRAFT_569047 [Hyaloscypha variabilis F]|uniref:2EXR domain-containing protein n=1 Tax=Hyaloscypha variabilis (strain UAMH 11265 / GT02V1 / F) TaxID=1149755 RepID=A0A2J6REF9_HYAVF|nr:hypothetical protein L207DRAFT_569047 [Hyaloscypha variabilis F]